MKETNQLNDLINENEKEKEEEGEGEEELLKQVQQQIQLGIQDGIEKINGMFEDKHEIHKKPELKHKKLIIPAKLPKNFKIYKGEEKG